MHLGTAYFDYCIICFILAYILNGILVRTVYKKSERVGFYRYFTYCFVVIDVLYSFGYSATQPFWYASPGIISFFSTAPWNANFTFTRIAMQLWFAAFVSLILCITCSFAYRYGLLCSPFVVSLFQRQKRFYITLPILTARSKSICILWLWTCMFFLFEDSEEIRRNMNQHFDGSIKSDFLYGYMLMVNLNNEETRVHKRIAAVVVIAVMECQIIVFVICGWKIHKTIKTRAMSTKLKNLHGRALHMLIAQTLNPLVFFFIPSTFNIFGIFVYVDYGNFSKAIALSFGLFPIVNPIIVIVFTEDYRRYLLGPSTSSNRQTQTVVGFYKSEAVEEPTALQ